MVDIQTYFDDCFNALSNIADKSIDLVVTDPPYLFSKCNCPKDYENSKSKFGTSELYKFSNKMLGEMSGFGEQDVNKLLDLMDNKTKVMNCYFFCSDEQVRLYCNWAVEHDCKINILVWEKPLSIISKNRFSTNLEYCVRVYRLGTHINQVDNNEWYNKVMKDKVETNKVHPTQKPISLFYKLISLSSNEGDVVLDPFMGSGTCGVACIQTKRNFIGIENDKKFYDIAVKRIDNEQRQLTLF